VILRISRNFVPVAVNLYNLRDARDEAGELFRAIHRQKPQYQGFWIVSPAGKVLAAHHDHKSEETWTPEVLRVLATGLKALGDVEPRLARATDPLPFRGKGVRDDGSVTLAIYVRYFPDGHVAGHGVRDSLTLSAREMTAFAPPESGVGREWVLPAAVVRKLGRCLAPDSDQSNMPRPEEVSGARITGKVRSVEGGVALATFEGSLAAAHKHLYEKGKVSHSAARLTGFARYDVRGRQLREVVLVLEGVYHMFPPYDVEARPTVAAVEWRLRATGR
jgi:hypothetical protein